MKLGIKVIVSFIDYHISLDDPTLKENLKYNESPH